MRQVQVADPDAVSARSAGRLRAPGRRETFAPMSRRPLLALFGVASAGALALTAAPEGAAQPSAMDARSTMEATAMEATAMDPTAPTSAMVAEGAPSLLHAHMSHVVRQSSSCSSSASSWLSSSS